MSSQCFSNTQRDILNLANNEIISFLRVTFGVLLDVIVCELGEKGSKVLTTNLLNYFNVFQSTFAFRSDRVCSLRI